MPVIDKISIDETSYEINVTGGYIKTGQLPNSTRGQGATIEGSNNVADGTYAHAEGFQVTAHGNYSHAENRNTLADGLNSHAEGEGTTAIDGAHAEGYYTSAAGYKSHAEGDGTTAKGADAHVEGYHSYAAADHTHAEGYYTCAMGQYSHSEGSQTCAQGAISHAEGDRTSAIGDYTHTEGQSTTANGDYSHAEGKSTYAGYNAHSESYYTKAIGNYSHAEGSYTTANGEASHAEGSYTYAGNYAHAENSGKAYGSYSHAEGSQTTATGSGSHAEGSSTYAKGDYSHVEGGNTTAEGYYSHAQGNYTTAKGDRSTAAGKNTIAGYNDQFVLGYYNDNREDNLFEIGNGDYNSRSNAFEVDKDGNLTVSGTITDGEGNVLTDLTNYIQKSETPGFIRNDGTIDNIEYVEAGDTFRYKVQNGYTDFQGNNIQTDGENIYYSSGEDQYVLDKTTDTQETKVQTIEDNIHDLSGEDIQTDGENIYFSCVDDQYVLDKITSTQNKKTWIGLTNFNGTDVQSDGTNIYYSYQHENETHTSTTDYQYVLDKETDTQSEKQQTGTPLDYHDPIGRYIQSYNDNIYYSESHTTNNLQYILDKETDTQNANTQGEEPSILGPKAINAKQVQFYGDNAYYSNYNNQYILNKDNNVQLEKEQTGLLTEFDGSCIQTDGIHIYYSGLVGAMGNQGHYVLNKATDYLVAQPIPGLIKNDGSVDTNTYLTSADLGDYIEKSSTAGLIKNDGTVDTNTYLTANTLPTATTSNLGVVKPDGDSILINNGTISGTKFTKISNNEAILSKKINSEVKTKTQIGLDFINRKSIQFDNNNNVYYSIGGDSGRILDKSTSTQNNKTQNGLYSFNGEDVQKDGNTIYYSAGDDDHWILNESTSTQSKKTQNGETDFYGQGIQTDGDNIYYSQGTTQYVLDKSTDTQSEKTQYGLTGEYDYDEFYRSCIQTDGNNIYYSVNDDIQYVLDKSTSTQSKKTQDEITDLTGQGIYNNGTNIYYIAYGGNQYILDKSTSTQTPIVLTGAENFLGQYMQSDGNNTYYSDMWSQYEILFEGEESFTVINADVSSKADKVTSATNGHLAGLDANGNLTDSGYSASDFNTPIATTSTAGKVKPDGSSITVDANGVISAAGGGGVATSVIGTEENGSTASKSYSTGEYFIKDDAFCIAIMDITSGSALTENTNYVKSNIANVLQTTGSKNGKQKDITFSDYDFKLEYTTSQSESVTYKQAFTSLQELLDFNKITINSKIILLGQKNITVEGSSYIYKQQQQLFNIDFKDNYVSDGNGGVKNQISITYRGLDSYNGKNILTITGSDSSCSPSQSYYSSGDRANNSLNVSQQANVSDYGQQTTIFFKY